MYSISIWRQLYWTSKYKYIKSFYIVADVSVNISYIIIWKQTIPTSQWLNIQQFIYLLPQGLLRVQAMFQGSCLARGSSEPQANVIMWHFPNKSFQDCCGRGGGGLHSPTGSFLPMNL